MHYWIWINEESDIYKESDIEILHQWGKSVKTKSQKAFGGNSYVCRSYREKTGRGGFSSSCILNRVNTSLPCG